MTIQILSVSTFGLWSFESEITLQCYHHSSSEKLGFDVAWDLKSHSLEPSISIVASIHQESPRLQQVKIRSDKINVFAVQPESQESKDWFLSKTLVDLKAILMILFLSIFWTLWYKSSSDWGLFFSSYSVSANET